MVDVALTTVILLVAAGGLSSTVISSVRLARVSEENADAYEAARAMTERIHAVAASEVFDTFAGNPDFDVPGLDPAPGDADGMVGRLIFPEIGGELREDFVDAEMGMPRDLNADGVIDALDHSDDYVILPVTIQMRWQGTRGTQTINLSMLVAGS